MQAMPYIHREVLSAVYARDAHNPILSADLELLLNTSGPMVRDAVRALRRAGYPVVATEHGYYMATKPEEVEFVITDLQKRISSMAKTVAAIRAKAYERFGTQGQFGFAKHSEELPGITERSTAEAHSDSQTEGVRRTMFPVQTDNHEEKSGSFFDEGENSASDAMLLAELIAGAR